MNTEKLKAELIRDEGLRSLPYKDTVGKLSIGVGRNLDDVGISKEEALFLLENDIKRTVASLNTLLVGWDTLDGVRQRVLANMAFNLGIGGLLKFKKTLTLIQSGKYVEASKEMLNSQWAKQVGSRALRLSEMLATGKEP